MLKKEGDLLLRDRQGVLLLAFLRNIFGNPDHPDDLSDFIAQRPLLRTHQAVRAIDADLVGLIPHRRLYAGEQLLVLNTIDAG